MADLNEFKAKLKQMEEAIKARLPEVAEVLAISAKGMAERNIKEKGFGKVYSAVKYPAWFLHGKELNQKGTKFLADRGVTGPGQQGEAKKPRRKKGETGDPAPFDKRTNWGEFRAAQGLQNSFVDLSYSNKMWANMQPVTVDMQGLVVRAFLGATNREAQEKMNYNRERYGDFIRNGLTEENGRVLIEVVQNELFNILEQIKL
jgi:hypothetical protein